MPLQSATQAASSPEFSAPLTKVAVTTGTAVAVNADRIADVMNGAATHPLFQLTWQNLAAASAFMVSLCVLFDWFWKRFWRPLLERWGWIKPLRRRTVITQEWEDSAANSETMDVEVVPKSRHRMRGNIGAGARIFLAGLSLSGLGLVGIAVREGYSDKAYPDPTYGTAVPTIGFGTTGPDIKMGDKITPVAALQRALVDAQKFEGALKRCVKVPLHQYEYDAYVHLTYNIGEGNFCKSTLVKKLNAEDYEGACNQILEWKISNKVDCSKPNKVCGGMWTDRLKTHRRCLGEQP